MSRPIDLYWRPGCGFCHRLRTELDRAGIDRTEHNIWDDPRAAAVVRRHAQGSETVPTVVVGGQGLVNPHAYEVAEAAELDPEILDRLRTGQRPTGLRSGPLWLFAAAALWVLLTNSDLTTTYHFAPIVVVLAWPVAATLSRGTDRVQIALAVVAGTATTAAVTAILHDTGRLAGPTLIGTQVWHEITVLTTVAAAIGGVLVARAPRSTEGDNDDNASHLQRHGARRERPHPDH